MLFVAVIFENLKIGVYQRFFLSSVTVPFLIRFIKIIPFLDPAYLLKELILTGGVQRLYKAF
jgi:hypothetical protein